MSKKVPKLCRHLPLQRARKLHQWYYNSETGIPDLKLETLFTDLFLIISLLNILGEGKRVERLLAALASDQMAGQPLCEYFKQIDDKLSYSRLRFWTTAQHWLADIADMDTLSRRRQANALINVYLAEDSPLKLSVAPELEEEMCYLLPKDMGLTSLVELCRLSALVSLFKNYHASLLFSINLYQVLLYK